MIFSTALLLGFVLQVPVQAPPVITIPRVEAAVVVDGRLDEAVWSQAARLTGFHQQEPVDGRPAEEKTEVLVWYAPDAIHFGIRALDSQPGLIRATQADRDNIDSEDHVILYLDTFADRRRAFFFSVNPLGVQGDGVRTEGAASAGRTFGGNIDNSPDFNYESRGRVTDEGYVVEVRIPFKSLRYPAGNVQRWGLQVVRKVQRTGYTDTWTDVRRASASFLLQAGTIDGLHDLERGVVFEAQPFVTLNAPGSFDVASGEFTRDDPAAETGINLRVGFTSMSVDATINPDFSQVESDAGQVTVNERFALFFPEKRPFFLEGIELFNTPGQLVYTRRIANPIGGAKLTGKLGSFGIAHLTAVDQNVRGTSDEALFNVTRLRQDFGSSSSVGVTYTDRALLESTGYNRVASGDMRLVFARLYYFEAQLANAWTGGDAGPPRSGPLWKVEVDRTGRSFGFNYSINGIDDDFHTDAGFVRRSGIVDAHMFNRFSWYGAPGAFVETASVYVNPARVWNYAGFGDASAVEGNDAVNLNLGLRGGWRTEMRGERTFFRPDPADYAALKTGSVLDPRAYTPLDRIGGAGFRVQVSTPTYQRFNATVALSGGSGAIFDEGAEGRALQASGSVSVRPTSQIRLTATTAYAQLDRRRDDSEFARSLIPRIKAEYQATRHLFLRAIVEHRSERRAALVDARTGEPLLRNGQPVAGERDNGLRVDALISYEPTPGTVAYFGYGSSYAETSLFERRLRRVDDGFFVKLAYQFRR